ncbi:MAG: hypothetical protein BWX72_00381 [Firmicutes bacterium ADurb.Bin080]|jgi:hypothetical protein|nr:MAG: hypothetical protein BWX72_00381 [Firmicutes bacterium ADurb.Bin080]
MLHVGQKKHKTMEIIKERIVKELEKKGMIISSVEKTDNNVYTLTGIYNEKRGSVRVRVIELDPEKFYYDDIIIPGLWEQIYIDIVFMDDNNFIFFRTIDVDYVFWDYLADYTSIIHVNLYKSGYKDPNYEV